MVGRRTGILIHKVESNITKNIQNGKTLKQILGFRQNANATLGSPGSLTGGGRAHSNYVSLNEEQETRSTASMRKLKRGKSKRGEPGLLQSLNPADSVLPKALTVCKMQRDFVPGNECLKMLEIFPKMTCLKFCDSFFSENPSEFAKISEHFA